MREGLDALRPLGRGRRERRSAHGGEFLREAKEGFDAEGYDAGYAEYAQGRMW